VDIVLFFETPFDWSFAQLCRDRGVKTALMPMYEWHLERPPTKFDLYINPSALDQRYFPYGTFIPVPAVSGIWNQRVTAQRFVHNSGHIGSRNHKGTVGTAAGASPHQKPHPTAHHLTGAEPQPID
jgi:hypothetical protein